MNQEKLILVVEDEPEQRELIVNLLQSASFSVLEADSAETAMLMLKEKPVDLVFSDWKLGSLSGIDLLNFTRARFPNTGFVIATAYGTISHAVEALQKGADDYLAKPFQRQELLLTVQKGLKAQQLRLNNDSLQRQLGEQREMVGLVGQAPCMQQVYQRIDRISNTQATVLILGESGTGKELAARALHEKSERKNQPFIAINCGAIAESIAEAELFGAEKGAFTGANATKIGKFEAANGGTVFLDEIGELPLSLQATLLRFLQEGTITKLGSHQEQALDVRVIAATHRDLAVEVEQKRFREDLYYRLNIVPINMPALRQRQEDIVPLTEHFLMLHAKRYGISCPKLDPDIYRALLEYHWPGNVRELSNKIERFVLLNDREELLSSLNDDEKQTDIFSNIEFTMPATGFCWQSFEKQCLNAALQQHQGNKTKAAKFLNLSYKAFLYRLEKYSIS